MRSKRKQQLTEARALLRDVRRYLPMDSRVYREIMDFLGRTA